MPSTNPTVWPTVNPTTFPSANPTAYPSPEPTDRPTASPNQQACENGGRLDIVFLVDTSVLATEGECTQQNEFAAELFTAVKGAANIVRASYIRFGADAQP